MKSETATYTGFEFEVDGYPAMAIINADLKPHRDGPVYPYSVFILVVPDRVNENGQPEEDEYDYLNGLEKEMILYLENHTQTVHVGHTTLYRAREIMFYTKDKEMVESWLEYHLASIERESDFEIASDPEWKNVADFYKLL